jgi:hypothetical protein
VEDLCVYLLNAIGAGASASTLDQLSQSPQSFNSGLYDLSYQIADVAVRPVTSVLLAVIFSIELSRVASKIDGDRQLGVQVVASVMFKCTLVFLAASNANLFLKAINGVEGFIVGQMQATASSTGTLGAAKLGDNLRSSISAAGVVGQSGLMVLLLLPFLASVIAGVVLSVVTFMIFIQLDLMASFASLPIAFIASEETKQMGIGFFKRYASTLFQAAVLWLGILFYRKLIATTVQASDLKTAGDDLWGFVISNFGNFFFGAILLIFLVMASSSTSKAILGD